MTDPLHIIVSEDEVIVAMMLTAVLENEGYRVTVTHNGRDALLADQSNHADILITDLRMPIMDGQQLIKLIKQRRPNIPVIVTTAYKEYMPEDEGDLFHLIKKPYHYEELIQKLAAISAKIQRVEAE